MIVKKGDCGYCGGDLSFWDFNKGNFCPHCGEEIEGFE